MGQAAEMQMNGALAAMLLPVSVRVLGALNCTEVEFVERAERYFQ